MASCGEPLAKPTSQTCPHSSSESRPSRQAIELKRKKLTHTGQLGSETTSNDINQVGN